MDVFPIFPLYCVCLFIIKIYICSADSFEGVLLPLITKKLQTHFILEHILSVPLISSRVFSKLQYLKQHAWGLIVEENVVAKKTGEFCTVGDLLVWHFSQFSNQSVISFFASDSFLIWAMRVLFEAGQFELLLSLSPWFLLLSHMNASTSTESVANYVLFRAFLSTKFALSGEFVWGNDDMVLTSGDVVPNWSCDRLYTLSLSYMLDHTKDSIELGNNIAALCFSFLPFVDSQSCSEWLLSSYLRTQINNAFDRNMLTNHIMYLLHLLEVCKLHLAEPFVLKIVEKILAIPQSESLLMQSLPLELHSIALEKFFLILDFCKIASFDAACALFDYDLAYNSLASITNFELRVNCLRNMLAFCERNHKTSDVWNKVLSYPWAELNGLEQVLVDSLFAKAKHSPIKDILSGNNPNFYFGLHSYFLRKSDFLGAAKYMHHFASRIENELFEFPSVSTLQSLSNALFCVLECLKNVSDESKRWIVWERALPAKRKCLAKELDDNLDFVRDIISVDTIFVKIVSVTSKLKILQNQGAEGSSESMWIKTESSITILNKLLVLGLFVDAVQFCLAHDLDMLPLIVALSCRCRSIDLCIIYGQGGTHVDCNSFHSISLRLEDNRTIQETASKYPSGSLFSSSSWSASLTAPVEKKEIEYSVQGVNAASRAAWNFLQSLLLKFDKSVVDEIKIHRYFGNGRYKVAIAETIFSGDSFADVPLWLLHLYLNNEKTYDFTLIPLLGVMLRHGLLEQVLQLSLVIVESACKNTNASGAIGISVDFFEDLFYRINFALPKLDPSKARSLSSSKDILKSGLRLFASGLNSN